MGREGARDGIRAFLEPQYLTVAGLSRLVGGAVIRFPRGDPVFARDMSRAFHGSARVLRITGGRAAPGA